MVWGCISAYVMDSLHVLEGTMNAERYIKVLEQHMLPSRRRVFQQDNAKPHTAAIQMRIAAENSHTTVFQMRR